MKIWHETNRGRQKRLTRTRNNDNSFSYAEIQFRLEQPQPPESVCSLPCAAGQAKKYTESDSCCWHCSNCTHYQVSVLHTKNSFVFFSVCPPLSSFIFHQNWPLIRSLHFPLGKVEMMKRLFESW